MTRRARHSKAIKPAEKLQFISTKTINHSLSDIKKCRNVNNIAAMPI